MLVYVVINPCNTKITIIKDLDIFDYVFGTFIGPSHPNNKGPSIFFLPYLDSKLTWPYQLSNK